MHNGMAPFKKKLYGLRKLFTSLHVISENGDPPQHVGSLIHKYIFNSVLCSYFLQYSQYHRRTYKVCWVRPGTL